MTTRRDRAIVRISSTKKTLRIPQRHIAGLVRFAAHSENVRLLEADIAIVGADEMAALNEQYLSHAGATDVLSFDLSNPSHVDAGLRVQIIVCGDVAVAEAHKRGCSLRGELMLYTLHGLLHLMGYDDTTPRAAAKMKARQDELLIAWWIKV